ncbi:MAG: putative signal peptide protein [Candidatus Eisenbacteria bacterium]|jgi:hypothetical protein
MKFAFTPARVTVAVIAVAVAAQLVPVERTNPPVRMEVDAPADVKRILERSCYDCHSNRTRWPWYSRVAPMSWLVARDVHEGREEINFSEWPMFDFDEQDHLLEQVEKQVTRGKMPLPVYLIMHGDAALSRADREKLLAWSRAGSGGDPTQGY